MLQPSPATPKWDLQSRQPPWKLHRFGIHHLPNTSQLHIHRMSDPSVHLHMFRGVARDNVSRGIWTPLSGLPPNWNSQIRFRQSSRPQCCHFSTFLRYFRLGTSVLLCKARSAWCQKSRYQWSPPCKHNPILVWLSKGLWWYLLGISCRSLHPNHSGNSLLDMVRNLQWTSEPWRFLLDKGHSWLLQQLAVACLQDILRTHRCYRDRLWKAWSTCREGMPAAIRHWACNSRFQAALNPCYYSFSQAETQTSLGAFCKMRPVPVDHGISWNSVFKWPMMFTVPTQSVSAMIRDADRGSN